MHPPKPPTPPTPPHPPRPPGSCEGKSGRDGLRFGLTVAGGLIIMGSGYLAERLGLLGELEAWQVWPGILVLMGLLKLILGGSVRHAFEGLILIGVGAAIELHYLGRIYLEWSVIWPALLILAGLIVFFAAITSSRRRKTRASPASRPAGSSPSSFVEGDMLFGSRDEKNASTEFEGGDIRCVMGGFNLDLRDARIKGDEAVLRVKVIMGGIELYVPDHWQIVIKASPTLGAFENKTRQRTTEIEGEAPPRLVIEGSVVMGGVEISN